MKYQDWQWSDIPLDRDLSVEMMRTKKEDGDPFRVKYTGLIQWQSCHKDLVKCRPFHYTLQAITAVRLQQTKSP
ncbi:hypothetical protein RRG08_058983 [Elysia crispata]|uniref:Uncharacterized protein n=1 Tax=Elysia crispata TaxID=231223 RepID=A0AAE1AXC5_9GAST|nr:hypothetical protein RRG08_058983 [Elysia crispata]